MTLPAKAGCLLLLTALACVRCQSDLPAVSYQDQLLAQRDAITNWELFSSSNNFTGWEDDLNAPFAPPVCQWTGVRCRWDNSVISLNLTCEPGPCAVTAEGTLAPELAEIATLQDLTFTGQALSGTLPEAWGTKGSFSKLTTLLLDANQLNGTLPASWGDEGAFPELVNLKLSFNSLSGTLPAVWSAMPSLEQLYLDFNMLTGELPASWGIVDAFPKLKALYLGSNMLSSTLPATWGSTAAFQALTDLNLLACTLIGTLPAGWGEDGAFPNLFILELAANQLTGALPASWGTAGAFPKLSSLSLANNLLSGSIPASWGSTAAFPELDAAGLGDNPNLCGPVPPNLYPAVCAPLPFGTQCVGTDLPACTASFPPATEADVAALLAQKQAISNWDSFAAGLGLEGWSALAEVCTWTGIVCTDQGSIISLELSCPLDDEPTVESTADFGPEPAGESTADFGSEPTGESAADFGPAPTCAGRPGGTLAPELASIKTLQSLTLFNLGLSGTLPASWADTGAFENLNSLTLDSNNLTGTLPDAWSKAGAFPRLQALSLAENQLNGSVPESWGNESALPVMDYIYLVGNKLTGTLPSSWGNPTSVPFLRDMDMSSNLLTGSLPASWGQNGSFPLLSVMYLKSNRLTGPLPDSWGTPGAFAELIDLNLEYNDLTGSIPTAWNTTGALPSLRQLVVAGNTEICGDVPYAMLEPVCGTEPSQCVNNEQIPCAGEPAPPTPVETSSSSTPVGAIVGGIVGGLALLALLAFLAVRPRKGWLRKRADVGGTSNKQPLDQTSDSSKLNGGRGDPDIDSKAVPLMPPEDPAAFSMLPANSQLGPEEEQLPFSYVTTAGYGKPGYADGFSSGVASDAMSPTGMLPSSQSDSLHSLESDPMLTFISTRLATIRQRNNSAHLSPTTSSNLAGNSGPLPAEMQQWEVQWESIVLERPIGKGSFGRVYLANWNATPVAVKVLINSDGVEQTPELELPDEVMKQLQEEAVVMSRMRHPNLVSFMGLCTLPPCILTEYCSRGSLYDVLRQASWRPECAAELTWQLRLSMAFDAARGLLYLHLRTPPIIHRDVKSPNMLVDEHWHVKVCDFNLSEILRYQPAQTPMGGDATNPMWLAPEVLSGEGATEKSDVYSFGLVLWEMMTWKLPWSRMPPYQVRRAVLDGRRPELPDREVLPGPDSRTFNQLDVYCQLIRDCWTQDPSDRPSFADIVPRLSSMLELASPVNSIIR